MPSMLTPFEKDAKSRPQAQQQSSSSMLEPIPSYTEAGNLTAPQPPDAGVPLRQPSPAPSTGGPDEPPAYALIDENQTSFMILGTFIHTPAGPAYQLSSPLDQRTPAFCIRRLRAREVSQVGAAPIAFDKSYMMYETTDPPLLGHQYHMFGKRRTCFGGVIEMKFGMSKWHIRHVPRPGAKPVEILTCKKVGAFGSVKLDRKKEVESSQWKDSKGRVVATEVLKDVEDGQGSVVPTLELSKDLDQTWRELLLSLWASRLWIAFGQEKTAAMGGRYGRVKFAKYSSSATTAGGAALVGLTVVGISGAGGF
ncbi:hypothetical protein BS50DRAFT_569695 [Corynespora cassiicola Philippines]|uniref:Uncharacterized protein n=1 Tax=Corynespora cassiicola Philippines TaxID=1448308 RepID=A0A2T2P3F7_CORCC|nr:hypothetical protein BS50DRAFT_569695 [Corynespora cassiicola Philippines]